VARKHNTHHNRSRSHYPERLAARGLSTAAVRMPTISFARIVKMLQQQRDATTLARLGLTLEDSIESDEVEPEVAIEA